MMRACVNDLSYMLFLHAFVGHEYRSFYNMLLESSQSTKRIDYNNLIEATESFRHPHIEFTNLTVIK